MNTTPIEKINTEMNIREVYDYEEEITIGLLAEKINEIIDAMNSKQDKACDHNSIELTSINGVVCNVCTECNVVIYSNVI